MDRHESLHVIGIGKWLILLLAICLLLGFLLWSLMGRTVVTMTAPGIISDDQPVKYVYAHQDGTVEQISVKTGDRVKFGQTLMLISPSSENDRTAQNGTENASGALPTRQIFSPIAGKVLEVYVNDMDSVDRTSPVLTIARDKDHATASYIYTMIPVSKLSAIRSGMTAYINVMNGTTTGQIWGTVDYILDDMTVEQLLKDYIPWKSVKDYVMENTDVLMTVPVRILVYQWDDGVYLMKDGSLQPFDLKYGSIVNVEFEISNYRPIDLIFPSGA